MRKREVKTIGDLCAENRDLREQLRGEGSASPTTSDGVQTSWHQRAWTG
jgi:hypothetical protein